MAGVAAAGYNCDWHPAERSVPIRLADAIGSDDACDSTPSPRYLPDRRTRLTRRSRLVFVLPEPDVWRKIS